MLRVVAWLGRGDQSINAHLLVAHVQIQIAQILGWIL